MSRDRILNILNVRVRIVDALHYYNSLFRVSHPPSLTNLNISWSSSYTCDVVNNLMHLQIIHISLMKYYSCSNTQLLLARNATNRNFRVTHCPLTIYVYGNVKAITQSSTKWWPFGMLYVDTKFRKEWWWAFGMLQLGTKFRTKWWAFKYSLIDSIASLFLLNKWWAFYQHKILSFQPKKLSFWAFPCDQLPFFFFFNRKEVDFFLPVHLPFLLDTSENLVPLVTKHAYPQHF